MPRSRLLPLMFILVLLLSGAISAMAQGRSPQARSSQGRDNCPVTSDLILGQAFGSTAGAEGEIGADGLTPDGEDIEANELTMDATWIMETLPYSEIGDEPVAILVMDDFSSEEDADILSHGWLVLQVFESLVGHLSEDTAVQITLVPVNIADQTGFSADLIVPRLEEILGELTEQGIERFVLNMSFVFIPCEDRELDFDFNRFVENRRATPDRSLIQEVGGNRDYVLSLLSDRRVAYIAEERLDMDVEQRIAPQAAARAQIERLSPSEARPTPQSDRSSAQQDRRATPGLEVRELAVLRLFENRQLEEDPLRDFLQEAPHLIVPVAASGNFKQEEPFYPARWPEVISVSADEGNDLRFWLNSNNAEITVPGAWNLFSDDVYRAGTSFAAPVLSTLIALDLTQSEPICDQSAGQNELAHETFENVLIAQAVEDFCAP